VNTNPKDQIPEIKIEQTALLVHKAQVEESEVNRAIEIEGESAPIAFARDSKADL
jgi:hypothetical protein